MCHFEGENQSLQLNQWAPRQHNSETTGTSGDVASCVLAKFKKAKVLCAARETLAHESGACLPSPTAEAQRDGAAGSNAPSRQRRL